MDALKAKYDKYVSDTAAQNAYKIAYDKWKVVAYAPGVLSANFCLRMATIKFLKSFY